MKLIRKYERDNEYDMPITPCYHRRAHINSIHCDSCKNFEYVDTNKGIVSCNIPDKEWEALSDDTKAKILETSYEDRTGTPWTIEEYERLVNWVKYNVMHIDDDAVQCANRMFGRTMTAKAWDDRVRIACQELNSRKKGQPMKEQPIKEVTPELEGKWIKCIVDTHRMIGLNIFKNGVYKVKNIEKDILGYFIVCLKTKEDEISAIHESFIKGDFVIVDPPVETQEDDEPVECQGCIDNNKRIRVLNELAEDIEHRNCELSDERDEAITRAELAEARLDWFMDHFGETNMPQELLRELINGFTPPKKDKRAE